MATTYVNLKGKLRWAKLREPDTFNGESRWITDLYDLDEESIGRFKDSGMGVHWKTDKEGNEFIRLRRPVQKQIKGEMVEFDPPKVVDAEGNDIPDDVLIGNGSEAVVNVAVYDAGRYKGHRLQAVKITNLVEYTGDQGGADVVNSDGVDVSIFE